MKGLKTIIHIICLFPQAYPHLAVMDNIMTHRSILLISLDFYLKKKKKD